MANMQPQPGAAPVKGSVGLGFVAGFFGSCIGLILVLIIAKGPDTKKGAWIGFGVAVVLGIIWQIVARVALSH